MNHPNAVPLEPSPEVLRHPLPRYLLATRPAFLSITLVGCLLGFAVAWHAGVAFDATAAVVALVLALLAHAGVNVLNDYYDHLNGTDAINTERLFPFTGGSRFIQNGVLTPGQMLGYGVGLFLAVIAGGAWLMVHSGTGLFWIGLAGLSIGWAYSAPPLRLNSRGLGEICVTLGFIFIVAGSDLVQRQSFAALPWVAGLPYALLVTNILYMNQFPDRSADLAAGKRHWVARLDPQTAALGYGLILLLAAAAIVLASAIGLLPWLAVLSLLGLLPGVRAALQLRQFAAHPARLMPAIQQTIAAAHLQPVLLAGLLMAERLL